MNLCQLKEMGYGVEVLRDGEFDSLCNVTTLTDEKCLSFAKDKDFIRKACKKENITALIIPFGLKDDADLLDSDKGIAICGNPKSMFYQIHNDFTERKVGDYRWNDLENEIGDSCDIHGSAVIADKNVRIGSHVVIEENVIIREGVDIGDYVKIMAGTIVGYDACLACRDQEGNYMPLLSAGRVKIGNNVWIGSYSVISKGLFPYETTNIGDYTQIGFCVDISHNVTIGKNVLIIDKSQVYGNTVIEDNVRLSPQTVISNRLRIGEGADVAIGSVVVGNVKKGKRVAGNYAIDNDKFLLWHHKKLRVNTGEGGGINKPYAVSHLPLFMKEKGALRCA